MQLHINEVDLNSNATNLESATAALSINNDSIEQAVMKKIWIQSKKNFPALSNIVRSC